MRSLYLFCRSRGRKSWPTFVLFLTAVVAGGDFAPAWGQQRPAGLPHGPAKKQTTLHLPPGEAEKSLIKAGLVNVQEVEPSIRVELKYSTTDNFVGVDVYGDLERAYLQREPAAMLARAQRLLQEKNLGYSLLVYDAARPRSIQRVLWDTLQKPAAEKAKYVANPKNGSIHNYGAAVDLTIARSDGTPLDMGTHYDFFGELAYPAKEEEMLRLGRLSHQQVANRRLLREVMGKAGFTGIESEWWHFNALSREEAKKRYAIIE